MTVRSGRWVKPEEYARRKDEGQLSKEEFYLVDALRKAATSQVGIYYEALIRTDRTGEAVDLASLVCNRYPLGDTYVEFMSAAKRAGARAEIRRLGDEALERLSGPIEKSGVRALLDKTFSKND